MLKLSDGAHQSACIEPELPPGTCRQGAPQILQAHISCEAATSKAAARA